MPKKLTTQEMREYMREKRIERKQKGLCVQCGSRKHAPGRVSCEVCLARMRQSKTDRVRRNRMDYEL